MARLFTHTDLADDDDDVGVRLSEVTVAATVMVVLHRGAVVLVDDLAARLNVTRDLLIEALEVNPYAYFTGEGVSLKIHLDGV